MPGTASRTRSAHLASNRSANCRVNTGGMCWTTTTGTGRAAGSFVSTVVRASGPPVEAPMASTSTRVRPTVARPPAGAAGAGTGTPVAATLGRGYRPAHNATILGTSCARTASMDAVTLPTLAGLVT